MIKIILFASGPTVGTDATTVELFPDDCTEKDFNDACFQFSIDNAEMYGYDVSDGSYIEDGEESEMTCDTADLDYSWAYYDPEQHDILRAGGGSFADDFAQLENG